MPIKDITQPQLEEISLADNTEDSVYPQPTVTTTTTGSRVNWPKPIPYPTPPKPLDEMKAKWNGKIPAIYNDFLFQPCMTYAGPSEVDAWHHSGPGHHITWAFPNGYGASCIQHKYSKGGRDGTWELAVTDSKGALIDNPITNDVLGHLTPFDVNGYLYEIHRLEKRVNLSTLEGTVTAANDCLDEFIAYLQKAKANNPDTER